MACMCDEKDDQLKMAVSQFGASHWKKIAEHVPGRSDVQCLHRWQKVLNPKLVKGPWTKEVRVPIDTIHFIQWVFAAYDRL